MPYNDCRIARAIGCATGLLLACAPADAPPGTALDAITAEDLHRHIAMLASDSFLGRGPASPGEERTVRYVTDEFRRLGLEPGDGERYVQEVPLVSITADPDMSLEIHGRGATRRLRYGAEFMAWTKRVVPRVELRRSELVFVGYGIVAPEYDWNDYAGADARGKTVVILVNDAGFATQDTALFNGNAMTYYGRWTYKYEEAARQGAAGALIVHETAPAGYPWDVVSGSWSGPQFDLVWPDGNLSRAAVEGWLTLETARAVFQQAVLSYDSLKSLAARRGFRAVPLSLAASVTVRNRLAESRSHNVLGVLRGSRRPDEVVVYMAHWDHLGVGPGLAGDSIYNGAVDNASGTAGLLEIAEAFSRLPEPPQRSVLFLATAAEEQGLLGSAYYAANPVFPLASTVAAINMDILNVWGPTRDVTVIGYGNSELDDYLADAARVQGRVLRADPEPEKGFYFRSDHFSLAKGGVPSLWTDAGAEPASPGVPSAREGRSAYDATRYHTPQDEYDPAWDVRGAVADLRLLFRVGYRLVRGSAFPNWREGTPFRAVRDSMRGAGR